ncbi:MAG: hypothetical protein RBR22_09335 [Desulfuromonas sp.]|jgi:hypothetical protein|nr:hypothetical protein [Desulfuromonas sp.]
MRRDEVPQDSGVLEDNQVVNYALDDEGNYCLTATAGWAPVNDANRLAWEDIQEQLQHIRQDIVAGKFSPLAYYMTRAQMDVALLARYAAVARWRVRRHLRPAVFKKLGSEQLGHYAQLFGISVAQLVQLPATDDLPMESGAVVCGEHHE